MSHIRENGSKMNCKLKKGTTKKIQYRTEKIPLITHLLQSSLFFNREHDEDDKLLNGYYLKKERDRVRERVLVEPTYGWRFLIFICVARLSIDI